MSTWIADIGSLLTFLTALLVFLQTRRNATQITTNSQKIADNTDQVQQVHVLVNSRLSDVVDRVAQLKTTLTEAGVPVPPNAQGTEDPTTQPPP